MVLAQVGLGSVAGGIVSFLCWVWSGTIFGFLGFLLSWYSPELLRLLRDWLNSRDLIAESQWERKHEGRLFSPAVKDD